MNFHSFLVRCIIAARRTDSPQIFPSRQQAENSVIESSGVLDRREVTEGGVRTAGLEESPFRTFLGC